MTHATPQYPLYNSTYTAYRLSPLYHGSRSLLDDLSLRTYAHRLRDLLRGDTLRGVDVGGFAGSDNGSTGALESCTWELLGDEAKWEEMHRHERAAENNNDDNNNNNNNNNVAPQVSIAEARGILVQLRYARATYTALLLRDPNAHHTPPESFTSLPLLLVRMPAALRATFTDFLATTFDTRIAPLKMRSAFLSATLETLLARLDADDRTSGPNTPLKTLQLQLAFPGVFAQGTGAPPLRCIDISITRDDVSEFFTRGVRLLSADPSLLKQQQQPHHQPTVTGPFTAALSHYLASHLALPLSHPSVSVSKLSLPPLLALSTDGKLKLFPPPGSATAAELDTTAADDELPTPEEHPFRAALAAFYSALIAYATSTPLANGLATPATAPPTAPLPLLAKKGKEKAATAAAAAKKDAHAPATVPAAKPNKRAAAPADATARRTNSPKRTKTAAAATAGAMTGPEEAVVHASAEGEEARQGTRGDGGAEAEAGAQQEQERAQSHISVPADPPPPYELHDPARVR